MRWCWCNGNTAQRALMVEEDKKGKKKLWIPFVHVVNSSRLDTSNQTYRHDACRRSFYLLTSTMFRHSQTPRLEEVSWYLCEKLIFRILSIFHLHSLKSAWFMHSGHPQLQQYQNVMMRMSMCLCVFRYYLVFVKLTRSQSFVFWNWLQA